MVNLLLPWIKPCEVFNTILNQGISDMRLGLVMLGIVTFTN